MKLKSYLRGLGLGMIITTIILVTAFASRNTQMTDQQIIDKALALGLVEPTLYGNGEKDESASDSGNHIDVETSGEGSVSVENQTLSTTEPSSEMATGDEKISESASETVSQKETESISQKETESVTQKPTEKETEKATEKVTEKQTEATTQATTEASKEIVLVFENITSADKASRILYDAGIIQNVDEFNAYLTSKNLATKVGEGTFTFKKGMTFEEIAKIITNQK